jgi:DNA-binding transcriptional ArsR family regulator
MSLLAAIAAPRRREILRLVWQQEASAGAIHRALPDVTFGAVSQHLRVLHQAGLVSVRREGRHRLYRALPESLGGLRAWLETMWDDSLYRLTIQAELEEARRGPRPTRPVRRTRRTTPATRRGGPAT